MPFQIQRANYYYVTVRDEPGEAYKLLSILAERGVNLVAFTAVPIGPTTTQLSVFPEDAQLFETEAKHCGLLAHGPNTAFLVQGDDALGELAKVHMLLYAAKINVYASSGVADGTGSFGYLIYVRPEDFEAAATALGI
ncbi:MAG: hypothetical protein RIS70_3505 [Planctomycetota bacterium]|jgi:hypothetical protein